MTEKTLTTENIKPALDALRGELAPWPVVAKKQDRLNAAQLNAANSGITSSLVAQIIANTAAIRALESAITGTGLRALVVASLPAIGTQGILYIVPVTTYDPATDADVVNYSNEYLWIVAPDAPVTEGYYEQVGQTGIVINNGQLTITVNGTSVGTFTANQSGDTTAAITVPTNADYVDLSTSQTVTGGKTWTGEQSFTLPIVGSITGTASKAIADEDGTSIKTGYGKLAGNQTWTGNNTFSGLKSTGVIRVEKSSGDTEFEIVNGEVDATTNTLSRQDDIRFYDKNTKITGGLRLTYTTDTGTKIELYARSWKADGTVSYNRSLTIYTNGQTGEYYTTLETNFLPKTTSVYSLGSSSYQWSAVYAQTYYYNGTQWGLDKANTWTGYNTFTNYIALQESAVIPAGGYGKGIAFRDYQSNRFGYIQPYLTPDSEKRLLIGVDSGDIASNSNIIPTANNAVNLGSSSYQWSSVYAQTYYYNGTAWGLDKANEWTGSNKFKSANSNFGLQSTIAEAGSTTATSNWIYWQDKNGFQDAYISRDVWGDGGDTLRISISGKRSNGAPSTSGASVECGIRLDITANGSKSVRPFDNGSTDLGTSTNKWKSFNGINPGALSLPDYNSTAKVDISGSIIPDQYGNIYYTPPINGWLYVCFNISNATTTTDPIFYIQAKDNNVANSNFVQTSLMPTSDTSSLAIFFPVVANKRFVMQINFSNYTIIKAHVIPCLGNV